MALLRTAFLSGKYSSSPKFAPHNVSGTITNIQLLAGYAIRSFSEDVALLTINCKDVRKPLSWYEESPEGGGDSGLIKDSIPLSFVCSYSCYKSED